MYEMCSINSLKFFRIFLRPFLFGIIFPFAQTQSQIASHNHLELLLFEGLVRQMNHFCKAKHSFFSCQFLLWNSARDQGTPVALILQQLFFVLDFLLSQCFLVELHSNSHNSAFNSWAEFIVPLFLSPGLVDDFLAHTAGEYAFEEDAKVLNILFCLHQQIFSEHLIIKAILGRYDPLFNCLLLNLPHRSVYFHSECFSNRPNEGLYSLINRFKSIHLLYHSIEYIRVNLKYKNSV